MIHNANELAAYLGARDATQESISRAVYKDTGCGAWAKVEAGTVRVGSIVEGSDVCTEVQVLPFPFEEEALDDAIAAVEAEAEEIWATTHGCDDCGSGDACDCDEEMTR